MRYFEPWPYIPVGLTAEDGIVAARSSSTGGGGGGGGGDGGAAAAAGARAAAAGAAAAGAAAGGRPASDEYSTLPQIDIEGARKALGGNEAIKTRLLASVRKGRRPSFWLWNGRIKLATLPLAHFAGGHLYFGERVPQVNHSEASNSAVAALPWSLRFLGTPSRLSPVARRSSPTCDRPSA